ncbi:uncharacterized protein N7503_003003 [Penicillium pulvis]|uniref:uncharacterized protein n=1 Tax=Penicillium pulvis TaxID=1562058 RepID=UPI00254778AC|nr:uncharacterized protein N7503_003003 [Penicillium pulvis]KAJ5805401.1 hypothetical protein N7503_003003 [Penicillium pulvis]
MQPLVLPPPSLTTAQFGQSRFNSGPDGFPLNRPWSTNARGCSPRAPLPRQSMSGSPLEEPAVTSEESRPRYPQTSLPAVTTAGEALFTTSQLPTAIQDPLPAPIRSRYGDPPPVFAGSPQLPPGALAPQYPLPGLETSLPGQPSRSLAPKSTRRTKAHVASACVNCKKKHLGCDPARPCRRCVLAGKAASCVDVTHKKRGRPPLKAEDSSIRPYTTHTDHPTVLAESQSSMTAHRTTLHRPTSSRELRPMTDLHAMGSPGATAGMRAPRAQQQRWSASVFPLTRPMDPASAIQSPGVRRPFSSSGAPSDALLAHPPPAFVPMTSGFNPVIQAGPMPPGMDRRFPAYAGPALPPPTSPPQHHHPTGVPFAPYAESPSGSLHPTIADPRLPPGPREPYLESPVRLPPIHQATASPGPPPPGPPPGVPHHAHRLSDPYPGIWTTGREENRRDPRASLSSQRPINSMFAHSPSHQRSSSSTAGARDPIPRHLGPIDLSSPLQLGHSPPIGALTAPSTTESDPEPEPRPVKRRKMALDDMVNG